MSRRARDIELLLLAAFAPLPLYFTAAIGTAPVAAFHVAMLGILVRLLFGRGPELVPLRVMQVLAALWIVFYPIDIMRLSGNAISASTHLVLFIAVYQTMESHRTSNHAQRLLTSSLLFIASIATATHISIVPFVVVFAFMMLRQLMEVSHAESARVLGRGAVPLPTARAAGFYLAGMSVLAIALFPIMPRIRNPMVQGLAGQLGNSSTGLSDSINFNDQRTITPDATVVSRVGMPTDAVPFFTPLRLRGVLYDRYRGNEWRQPIRIFSPLPSQDGVVHVARGEGLRRTAYVQQQVIMGGRLFLPVGTYEVSDLPFVVEAPTRDIFSTTAPRNGILSYSVRLARQTAPRQQAPIHMAQYPVTQPVAAMARQIVGSERDPMRQAAAIEQYLSSRFQYIPDPSQIGKTMNVDQFLLSERRGHCEYFAAGMVALMTSLNVPARIAGGFYGGKLNPLTGYFVVRREDAHAWVEAWDGTAWRTFDPTPAGMRPGNTQAGLFRVYASAISDSLNFFWDRYVLTFGVLDQITLLTNLISSASDAFTALRHFSLPSLWSKVTPRTLAILFAIIGAVLMLSIIIHRYRATSFDLLSSHLSALGIEVGPAMTMEEALRLLRAQQPERAQALEPLVALYEEERFAERRVSRKSVRQRLAELR